MILTTKQRLINFGIGGIVGLIVAFSIKGCGKEDKTETTITVDSTITKNEFTDSTIQGTKGKDSLVYLAYPVYYTDSFFQQVDTAAILRDYYGTKVYTNRYITDHLDETIIDTVTENKITGRKRITEVTCYDTTINTITTIRKSADGLYLGLQTNLKDIAPSVLYLKGRSAYGAGWGIRQKEVQLMYYYKLGK